MLIFGIHVFSRVPLLAVGPSTRTAQQSVQLEDLVISPFFGNSDSQGRSKERSPAGRCRPETKTWKWQQIKKNTRENWIVRTKIRIVADCLWTRKLLLDCFQMRTIATIGTCLVVWLAILRSTTMQKLRTSRCPWHPYRGWMSWGLKVTPQFSLSLEIFEQLIDLGGGEVWKTQ